MDMSAVCALLNLYGSRRRFPPWTEFASARSPNPYPQYKVKNVTLYEGGPNLPQNVYFLNPIFRAILMTKTRC